VRHTPSAGPIEAARLNRRTSPARPARG
jgi:hypothetical protein